MTALFSINKKVNLDFMDAVACHRYHVESEKEEKEDEELVILVPYTTIHEGAMVIEALYALVTVIAMHSVLWSQVFAANAYVV